MILNMKQLFKYRKTDDSQKFAYVCFRLTTVFKIQHYGIYQPNHTKHGTSEENVSVCGTSLGGLVPAVNLSPKALLSFVEEWQFLFLDPYYNLLAWGIVQKYHFCALPSRFLFFPLSIQGPDINILKKSLWVICVGKELRIIKRPA